VAAQRSNGKQQRAASRERRRAQAAPEPPDEAGGSDEAGASEALHAARAAAAAAAVGAAVGAARAIASRRDDAEDPAPSDEARPQDQGSHREELIVLLDEETPEQEQPAEAPPSPAQPRPAQPRPEQPERPRTGASGREAAAVVRRAREQLRDLQGSEPESVSSLEQSSEGWLVRLEVVEVRRVPDSTDVLASYEVELDDDGGLLGYRRVRRYYRAQSDANGEGS